MKERWLPLVGLALVLVGCAPDRTLATLIPRSSLAVLWIERPELLPTGGLAPLDLPPGALGTGPWAASVHPGTTPGFRLYLTLKDEASWPEVETWARTRGGFNVARVGRYAVLSSPGLPTVAPLDIDQRFSQPLGGDAELFVDASVVDGWVEKMGWKSLPFPWQALRREVLGVRLSLERQWGGWKLVVTPSLRAGAWKEGVARLGPLRPLDVWGPRPVAEGWSLGFSVPVALWQSLGNLRPDRGWRDRWSSFSSIVGPRGTATATPGSDGSWSWVMALESPDPQAVRQGLKALVAGGDVQAFFPWVAEDGDTPVIFQDRPDGRGGAITSLTVGPQRFVVGYGIDRVVVAGGPGAPEAVSRWTTALPPAPRVDGLPWAVAQGTLDGLGARAQWSTTGGQPTLTIEVSDSQATAWTERLPQVLVQWVSGEGGWTVFEP